VYIILTSWLLLKEVMTVVSYRTPWLRKIYMSDTQAVIKRKSNYSAYQCHVDPDLHGSALILEGWIRILNGKADSVPDLGVQK
jgi:hypothetical protein